VKEDHYFTINTQVHHANRELWYLAVDAIPILIWRDRNGGRDGGGRTEQRDGKTGCAKHERK
jgi:hypothetical protein